jgi:hypothetical protein
MKCDPNVVRTGLGDIAKAVQVGRRHLRRFAGLLGTRIELLFDHIPSSRIDIVDGLLLPANTDLASLN